MALKDRAAIRRARQSNDNRHFEDSSIVEISLLCCIASFWNKKLCMIDDIVHAIFNACRVVCEETVSWYPGICAHALLSHLLWYMCVMLLRRL